ncbi:MAG: prephenate dehydrogenase [Clostridium sp.]|jgi:prephenate dehydrogenase|nr:prephenate dehydrogenase [Clostridium sp.]
MKFDRDTKILIVGLGLIGGSYAEALSSGGYEVGAIDCNADSIAFALEKGWISSGRADTDGEYIGKFDLIVFALYPHIFIDWIKQNQRFIRPGALLTDVTGVKCSVVYEVQKLLRSDLEFIGAHPMAGREVSGVRNAKKEIFTDANYIVTPTESNTLEAIAACKALGRAIGFKNISTLTPEKHDEIVGFLSHLTHCIAVALMISKESEHMCEYTGDSFRDLTRIAKINDVMWSELFMLNKTELLAQMKLFEAAFDRLRISIEQDDTDALREMMRLSAKRREYFDIK